MLSVALNKLFIEHKLIWLVDICENAGLCVCVENPPACMEFPIAADAKHSSYKPWPNCLLLETVTI